MQLLIASAILTTVFAVGPPAPYAPRRLAPQPYAYEYEAADDYRKANFKKIDTHDADGVVAGSFVIPLPDSVLQKTTYTAADTVNRFVADVTYN